MRSVFLTLLAIGLLSISSPQGICDELTEKEFQELQVQLTPDSSELWRTIPWKIALLDAQRTAAKESKPIFIWAMDGHPLGCT